MIRARDATAAAAIAAVAAGRLRLSARVVGCWWRQRRQRELRSFISRVVVILEGKQGSRSIS